MNRALPTLLLGPLRMPLAARIALAAVLVVLALLARFALAPVLPADGFPFLTFFPAVLLAAFLGGLWPGLLAALCSLLAAWYFFMPVGGSFGALNLPNAVAVASDGCVLVVVCVVIHLLHRALARATGAEQQVRDSEQQLRLLLDNVFVHVCILGLDGALQHVNRSLLHPESRHQPGDAAGGAASAPADGAERQAWLGRRFHELPWFAGDTALQSRMQQAVRQAAAGDRLRLDLQVRDAAGECLTLDLQIAPLRQLADGPVTGIVVCAVDVSARAQAIDDLARSQAQAVAAAQAADAQRRLLDATFNAVPAGIIVADAQGRLLRTNRANAQIWGPKAPLADSVEGYGAWKGWWADGSARHGQPLQAQDWGLARSLRGEVCTDLIEIEPPDMPGQRRVTLLSSAPVFDAEGRVQGGVVAQVDITARMRAEQALRDSEAMFRAVADNIPQLAWLADAQGRVHWCNQRWYEYTGLDPDAPAPQDWSAVHDPAEAQRVAAKFSEHVASGEPWEDTFAMRGRDGTYRWFLSRALPVCDDEGRVARWFGTNTDITDQLLIERALRDSEDRLLAREAALREADRQKDMFLATLGHELRNPLSPIRSAAQLIRISPNADPQVLKMGGIIERQAAHLARLVDDLLDVSRVTFGQVRLQPRVLDLRRVVELAVETCRPKIDSGDVRFSLELGQEPLTVDADETRVAQAVANVLHNAFKFTPAGGEVQLRLQARGGWAAVTVRDTGQGVAQEMLDKVFDLFAQERRSGMGGNTGLGIGLALARKLVEMHGGSIHARSAGAGQGAEFEMLFPLREQPPPPVQDAAAPVAAANARVLLVDDHADTVETLGALLQMQGHTVFTAQDGASALAAVRAHGPDVVLLDIGLPDINGHEVARRIREDTTLRRRPLLVALTGWGQDDDRAQALAAGFDQHMTKPADPEALDRLLREHLAGRSPD